MDTYIYEVYVDTYGVLATEDIPVLRSITLAVMSELSIGIVGPAVLAVRESDL
jgi:hypothetical protein